ncbi:MAG: diaminopimelate epimerase [Tidjanibacter sp.]|nr:diaminopimelate epimerase [Tidjanibacter sp.]
MQPKFEKYEGAGNDFIIFDARDSHFLPDSAAIAAICDRRRGIGADGVMLLRSSLRADFEMLYFNSDGGAAAMCGNGGRCIAWFADRLGIGGNHKTFEAPDGLHTADIVARSGFSATVRLGMRDVDKIAFYESNALINTGVPHLVKIVDDFDFDVVAQGRLLRNAQALKPDGANVDFVRVIGDGHIAVRTYERGVEDETLACGTGVTASAIAVNKLVQPNVHHFIVDAMGGTLAVDFTTEDHNRYSKIFLTGPARTVFAGSLSEENFR